MKKIYDAANITEAHIVTGMLQANGINAFMSGHYLQGGVGELAVEGFAAVLVNDDDETRARALIDEYEHPDR